MNNQIDDSLLPVTALSDLTTILKDKGLSSGEIAEMLLKIITEVEMELVEELMETLPEEKKQILQQCVDQNKTPAETAEALDLDEQHMQEIEMRKFTEIVQKLVPSINLE
ncbi:MAG TPA: hypothetical protein VLF68_01070 [Candidatus Saccharimonadales bacterium]|nr:hypothetical protein [Candidatus Saccharimonadales bacterium]